MARCPIRSLAADHFRLDGSCLCGPRISPQRLATAMVEHELYWWHAAIITELERIAECAGPQHGRAAHNTAGIAGNLRGFLASDTDKYCDDLIRAGLLRDVEPLWDTTVPLRFVEVVPDAATPKETP